MPQKKSTRIADLDAKVTAALADLRLGKFSSQRAATKAYGISPSTFNDRVNGGRSIAEAREPYQHLTAAQEQTLVDWIEHQQSRGHPIRYQFL